MLHFPKSQLADLDQALNKEWLVTNGLGGFAASTITGCNTRRYHGLLIASLNPPTQRLLLLSKLEEKVIWRGKEYLLGVNETTGGFYPQGQNYLLQFSREPLPRFLYAIEDLLLEKIVFMIHGQNTTVVRYRVWNGSGEKVEIRITPLVNCRDYHGNVRRCPWPWQREDGPEQVRLQAWPEAPALYLRGQNCRWQAGPGYWFENMVYRIEQERGLESVEDHYMPGEFIAQLDGDGELAILASVEPIAEMPSARLLQVREEKRLAALLEQAGYQHPMLNALVLAADQFIVRRASTGTATVIAGYPWFTDWGRDTMIALPGLTLVTRRFEVARELLQTFARYLEEGLIPNRFPDGGERPDYNTVDASLWYFQAVFKYLEYTGDYSFVYKEIYPVLREILAWHQRGTRYNIKMDEDGLLTAGSRGTQLTWMDAKVGDWVVTPREGKAVEINALWYNALKIAAELARRQGESARELEELARLAASSFNAKFWYAEGGYLYDVIDPAGNPDPALRPNQILAVSLPHQLLDPIRQKLVVRAVWRALYTPYGLRSLAADHPRYQSTYIGDRWKRDGAYHQGTAWSWLIGPFLTALRKVHNYDASSREIAEKLLEPFRGHLFEAGVGTISEIFDGDHPHTPRGCFAQAWGVAEVLRAWVEEIMQR
ncbi:glycogen debranching enzyme, putative [Carboxydocella sporoproducens DSM 16521]|uniref:Glycogen debranching enzyme, putative n=2 Tax=Carboxydocella TaxID=178898 RepID=A0A1T4R877_9FIRM|nr:MULTISPECIES: amylo-alpha-1,6-glucosidase [Carboxydocella]AVX19732.1 glycogen debranching enzyme, putative [Carboxydocella thermautotrophica]AVX30143.1 glycogen debranching enzyme, putative [Carboxydocella thermautotrophica]SKA12139.1 glycogen debranching enzyme, putative [Carboxydocella sporoproducens DSM 16521]